MTQYRKLFVVALGFIVMAAIQFGYPVEPGTEEQVVGIFDTVVQLSDKVIALLMMYGVWRVPNAPPAV